MHATDFKINSSNLETDLPNNEQPADQVGNLGSCSQCTYEYNACADVAETALLDSNVVYRFSIQIPASVACVVRY